MAPWECWEWVHASQQHMVLTQQVEVVQFATNCVYADLGVFEVSHFDGCPWLPRYSIANFWYCCCHWASLFNWVVSVEPNACLFVKSSLGDLSVFNGFLLINNLKISKYSHSCHWYSISYTITRHWCLIEYSVGCEHPGWVMVKPSNSCFVLFSRISFLLGSKSSQRIHCQGTVSVKI